MATNLNKYVQLNDFLLLEYEFNKSGADTSLGNASISSIIATNLFGNLQYFNEGIPAQGVTNNTLILNSEPTNAARSSWYFNPQDTSGYGFYFDSSVAISVPKYPLDTVRVHIVSGYNFDDITGFLLQIQAQDVSGNLVDLSNFTWAKQVQGNNDVLKFSSNTLLLGNRFYDKYVEFMVPSVQNLGGDIGTLLGQTLNIKTLSDVFITYSTIPEMNVDTYIISEAISLQLPVSSPADDFNCLIAESTGGDYIEFYATFRDLIIGEYMGEIESGRIPLYTSSNPNDNYQDFSEQYGAGSPKWVLMHELYVYEHIGLTTSLLTQKYVFTQEDNFMVPNSFRPVLKNADIDSSYTIKYVCRLMNRMDGTQIIRVASFSSQNPKKYGLYFSRINVDNYIPYKVFNRLGAEASPNLGGAGAQRTKFVKVYYDSVDVMLNMNNEVLPQGTGPLFLKQSDGVYLFKFNKVNTDSGNQSVNVDLSGAYNYALVFVLDDQTKIEIGPTFSLNMNVTLGQLEFKILQSQAQTLLSQTGNSYSIVVKNPDGTQYTFYEGVYYSYKDFNQVVTQFQSLFDVTSLNTQIATLQAENQKLSDENAALKAK
jgi:hypothetical protein